MYSTTKILKISLTISVPMALNGVGQLTDSADNEEALHPLFHSLSVSCSDSASSCEIVPSNTYLWIVEKYLLARNSKYVEHGDARN